MPLLLLQPSHPLMSISVLIHHAPPSPINNKITIQSNPKENHPDTSLPINETTAPTICKLPFIPEYHSDHSGNVLESTKSNPFILANVSPHLMHTSLPLCLTLISANMTSDIVTTPMSVPTNPIMRHSIVGDREIRPFTKLDLGRYWTSFNVAYIKMIPVSRGIQTYRSPETNLYFSKS